MRLTIFAVSILLSSSLLCADKYEYTFKPDGVPNSRVELSTGEVQIYSSLHKKKFSEELLHKIYKESYNDMSYAEYMQLVAKKYKDLTYKTGGDYHWININEFSKINELIMIK